MPANTGGGSTGGSSWEHLQTAKERLNVEWRESRVSAEVKLAQEDAIKHLRKDDPRPLLILRDCGGCANKEGDLLKRSLEDERFILGTGWFHCVKLPHEVIEEDNPLSALFTGNVPAHIVVATWDAEKIVPINRASAKEMWTGMAKVLKQDYKKSPDKAMKGLQRMLIEFDKLDGRVAELEAQLAAREAKGQDARANKVRNELAELEKDRLELFAQEQKLRDLKLRPNPERDGEDNEA